MSRIASKLPDTIATDRHKPGPSGACDIYGHGDLDDWRAIERLRATAPWVAVQEAVDAAAGITDPIDGDKFRYHWRRKCWHWTTEQRRATLDGDA